MELGELGGIGDVEKTETQKKLLQAEDEAKCSCEKLRAVSGVLLVVAVCQNTPFIN